MLRNSIRLQFVAFVFSFTPLTRWYAFRARLLKWAGVECNRSVRIVSSARVVAETVHIGEDTFIGHQVLIAGAKDGRISIGDYVDIGPRVTVVSGTHQIDMQGPRAAGDGFGLDVEIGDGSWIGAASTILPGVKIGRKAVIGAGSVVVSDIPSECIAVGNPCKPIKFWVPHEGRYRMVGE